jgi:hypothetical protein
VDVRAEKSLVCALDGYPAQGCGDPVGDAQVEADEATVAFTMPAAQQQSDPAAQPEAAEESDDGGLSPALIAVLVLIAALAVVAVPLYRRNRES